MVWIIKSASKEGALQELKNDTGLLNLGNGDTVYLTAIVP